MDRTARMVKRAVVNVATDSWVLGQNRLLTKLAELGENCVAWANAFPPRCPPHWHRGEQGRPTAECVPYAFKAYALQNAAERGYTSLLWCDAAILPIQPLTSLWERIERDGYCIVRNGWTNYEWTADDAYPYLFPEYWTNQQRSTEHVWEDMRAVNKTISHVVGTAFGLSVSHPTGASMLKEYFALAQTKAFIGPWQNSNSPTVKGRNTERFAAPCGPPEVLGHRHDQAALSVVAWRHGCTLVDPPDVFAYAPVGEQQRDPRTILEANGFYE